MVLVLDYRFLYLYDLANPSKIKSLKAVNGETVTVELISPLGQVLRSQELQADRDLSQPFDLSGMEEGLYLVRITLGERMVLKRLAIFSEAQVKLRGKIMGAMIYPIMLMLLANTSRITIRTPYKHTKKVRML